jgi:hypothetical protein
LRRIILPMEVMILLIFCVSKTIPPMMLFPLVIDQRRTDGNDVENLKGSSLFLNEIWAIWVI